MESPQTIGRDETKLFWIALGAVLFLLVVMVVATILLWGQPDPRIAYVPLPILQWSFLGGMVAVLYRLANQANTPNVHLYIWIITKPIIGMVMGAMVFFLAVGGVLLLSDQKLAGIDEAERLVGQRYDQAVQTACPKILTEKPDECIKKFFADLPSPSPLPYSDLANKLWLNAFAFIGGFSNRFALGIIGRVTSEVTHGKNKKNDHDVDEDKEQGSN